jgi:hypothetical protein
LRGALATKQSIARRTRLSGDHRPLRRSTWHQRHVRETCALLPIAPRVADGIIHGGSSVELIYVTEKGFCVDPRSKYYNGFPWKPEHYYNPNIVSLRPWIANIVLRTIEACLEIMFSLASEIPFPAAIAPGHQVFIRDPANKALIQLLEVDQGNLVWWGQEQDNAKADVGQTHPSADEPPTATSA